jgi:hypothetical protein
MVSLNVNNLLKVPQVFKIPQLVSLLDSLFELSV